MPESISKFAGRELIPLRNISFPLGRHSKVTAVSAGKKKLVFKQSSLGKNLTPDEARLMVSAVKEYHSRLEGAGINVSKILLIDSAQAAGWAGKGHFVESLEEFINEKNAAQVIASAKPKKAILVFRKIIAELRKAMIVPSPKGSAKAGVLIDSAPKNYVIGNNGKAYLVDFYTPKLIDAGGRLFPYFKKLHSHSRQELQTRFEDKNALFHVLLVHSIAERPELRKQFEKAALSFLQRNNELQVAKYIRLLMAKDYRATKLVKPEILEKIPESSK